MYLLSKVTDPKCIALESFVLCVLIQANHSSV